MEYDEAHIIQDVLEGKTSRYEYFLDKYGQQVFTLIVRIVASQEDAEELTQDTFLKAFRHLSSFKAESNFSTWIYRIAYNTAISAVRKKKYDLFDMDDTLLANISDEQIDDTLNDESEVQIAKLNKAMKKLDAMNGRHYLILYGRQAYQRNCSHIGNDRKQHKSEIAPYTQKIVCTYNQ